MSTKAETLDDSLARIKECGHEPALNEAVLEAFVLIDLYRAVLGYDKETARLHGHLVGENGKEIPDITLELLPSNNSSGQEVIVEIKKYNHFSKGRPEHRRNNAIRQAARYIITKKSRYGIVTDGVHWTYFVVTGSSQRKVVRRVAEFHIEQNLRLSKLLLARSKRSELLKLFELLTRLHETMSQDELDEIHELKTLKARVERVWRRHGDGSLSSLSIRDKKLLRAMYNDRDFPSNNLCAEMRLRK